MDGGNGGDNWSYKSCKAPVKSSPPTNQHPTFYRPDALPVAQPTVSEHIPTFPCKKLLPFSFHCCWHRHHSTFIEYVTPINYWISESLLNFLCRGNGSRKKLLADSFCRWRHSDSSIMIKMHLCFWGNPAWFFHPYGNLTFISTSVGLLQQFSIPAVLSQTHFLFLCYAFPTKSAKLPSS